MNATRTGSAAKRAVASAIIALTLASIAFRLLVFTGLEHTSLVFIGIPALLALALTAVEPRTTAGTIHKTIALALCMSGIVFGEGFICIVMAAPLFFLVGAIVARRKRNSQESAGIEEADRDNGTWRRLGIALLIPLSLEGVVPHFERPREEAVSVSRIIPTDTEVVRAALASPMRFDQPLPLFFKLGFPVPGATSGQGLAIGDLRSVEFVHGGHHPGALVLEVTHSEPGAVVFSAVADDSYITHWLAWRSAEVKWKQVAPGQTRVTWTLRYRRRLDPSWYFAPLERYGVRLAATYLIETLATPRVADD